MRSPTCLEESYEVSVPPLDSPALVVAQVAEQTKVIILNVCRRQPGDGWQLNGFDPALEVTQRQIVSQSPTDATRFWCHLYGS